MDVQPPRTLGGKKAAIESELKSEIRVLKLTKLDSLRNVAIALIEAESDR
jgi:hypothetical protein